MDELVAALQTRIPAWKETKISLKPLPGGLTNQNYTVTVGDQQFVLRICAEGAAIHGIDRRVEMSCYRAAAEGGLTPEFVAFFEDFWEGRQALVTRFVDGHTLGAADVRDAQRLPRIAHVMCQVHRLPHFAGHFNVFQIFAQGLSFCRTHNAPLPTWIDQIEAAVQRIEVGLRFHPIPPAACHNDLIPANLIEETNGRLWLVDWEYAGWGDPFFDLGNLAVNNEFGEAEDAALLTAYFGTVNPHDWAHLQLMKILSDAREGIWGMVQTRISDLPVDFVEYGTRHLERFMHNYTRPVVNEWLRVIATEQF